MSAVEKLPVRYTEAEAAAYLRKSIITPRHV